MICKHAPPCPLPDSRYGEGYHAAREKYERASPRSGDGLREKVAKRLEQVLDAYERRRTGFPLDYETETAIVEAARSALSSSPRSEGDGGAKACIIPRETEPGRCFGCGAEVVPSLCLCGRKHVGVYCWPCHHKNNPDRCASPFCPEHAAPSSPAPTPGTAAAKATKEE